MTTEDRVRPANLTVRRRMVSLALVIGAILLVAFSVGVVRAVMNPSAPDSVSAANALAGIKRVPLRPVATAHASQIPVLVYHEMNNGCAPAAKVCIAHDYETVSYRQFYTEMAWMHRHGYHTITIGQYLRWLKHPRTKLPTKPFLITVDNGITNFLVGAQPVLYHFRYQATAFLVTGFADGADGHCAPPYHGVNVQPGCPTANKGWDARWSDLQALSPAVYGFALEAGASGHFQQTYDKKCNAFYACRTPGETVPQYQTRVRNEIANGIRNADAHLGWRFNPHAWVVPYSDLGYPCQAVSCAYEAHTGPDGWLTHFAARTFQAAFVQDAYRNNVLNERFRYEIHGDTTLHDFKTALRHYRALGAWRAR